MSEWDDTETIDDKLAAYDDADQRVRTMAAEAQRKQPFGWALLPRHAVVRALVEIDGLSRETAESVARISAVRGTEMNILDGSIVLLWLRKAGETK